VSLGKRVAVVEKGIVGGECPNFACVPTKALLHAASTYRTVRSADKYGVKAPRIAVDWKGAARFRNLVVSRTGTTHGESVLRDNGIHLLKGIAHFLSPNEIEIGSKRYTAAKFLIATGSSPFIPPIPGLHESGYITYNEAGDFTHQPKSLVILGAGAVGCEFAQIYSTFGVKVTIVESLPRLLSKEDEEVGQLLHALFEKQGITVLLGTKVTSVEKDGAKRKITYERDGNSNSMTAERILVATGKQPNLDLGLDRAGVKIGEKGIRVNHYLQTTMSNIYAAGDVTGPYLFTHTGEYQSEIAARNAFSYKKIKADYRIVPRCIYTSPEVAAVGLTEAEAKARGIRTKKGVMPYEELSRAKTEDTLDGFAKVICDSKGVIIGGAIVGERAGELIHEIALAIKFRVKASDIAEMMHAYPTYSEAVKYACANLE
jgi:pyruvate/2-oxoglutarate dehydrogenase complex dihydrolipoamide dehydrogenase (E3) component